MIEKSGNSVTLTKIQSQTPHSSANETQKDLVKFIMNHYEPHWQYQGSENLPSSETGEAWGHLTTIFGNMRTITDFNAALKRPSIP